MARLDAGDLAQRLGQQAEAVCRHYLDAGRRQGNYWQVGDVRNSPGRSMFVRLKDSAKGPAGKWQDAATGEHGDLLDVIRESLGLSEFADVTEEARRFLKHPHPKAAPTEGARQHTSATGLVRSGAAALRHVAADQRHHRRSVLTQTRHHDFARNRQSPLPSPLLLSAR